MGGEEGGARWHECPCMGMKRLERTLLHVRTQEKPLPGTKSAGA